MILFLEWCKGVSNFSVCLEIDVVPSTVTRWYGILNELVYNAMYENVFNTQIGGPGEVVEIDETLLVKNKYGRSNIIKFGQLVVVLGEIRIVFLLKR
jgi:hypothetical protein